MKRFAITIFTLLAAAAAVAQTVTGTVFDDRNGDGVRQKGERGLKNILVSNGRDVVATSSRGEFSIECADFTSVFPIMPSDYAASVKGANTSFYYADSPAADATVDFGLVRRNARRKFRMAAVGDVQVDNAAELGYACRTIVPEIARRTDLDFSIWMGDLVNDNPDLLLAMKSVFATLPQEWWTVIGNHDRDKSKKSRTNHAYCRNYGAANYAFYRGDCLFIVLDNAFSLMGEAAIEQNSMELVRNIVALTPRDKLIVFCQHIPMQYTSSREELFKIVEGRKALFLSAHMHCIERKKWSDNIEEITVGASCGSFWVGERDYTAVPNALQHCGSPRNYFTVDFDSTDYKFRYKGVGLDAECQMDIWIKGTEPIDAEIKALAELPDGMVVANIYGGGEQTEVVMRINGRTIPMTHTAMPAPLNSRIASWNRTAGYPTKFSRRIPMLKRDSPHVWTALLPADLPAGAHTLSVEASDPHSDRIVLSTTFYSTPTTE